MGPHSVREYAASLRPRYRVASRGDKGHLLDEFCGVTGRHRKAVRLFMLGWRSTNTNQQKMAETEIQDLPKWCLNVISPGGDILDGQGEDDSLGANYYFLVSFLDEADYFKGDPFWAPGRNFPDAVETRDRLMTRILKLDLTDQWVRGALEKLKGQHKSP